MDFEKYKINLLKDLNELQGRAERILNRQPCDKKRKKKNCFSYIQRQSDYHHIRNIIIGIKRLSGIECTDKMMFLLPDE